MNLPTPILTYFEADQSVDGSQLLDAFAPDAVVSDEGDLHTGHSEIAAWWRSAKDKYDHTARPIDLEDRDGAIVVRAEVSGDFPGSPTMLGFAFQLKGDRISTLEIGA